jgi:hypothetical protein
MPVTSVRNGGLPSKLPGLLLIFVAIAPSGMMFVTGEATFSWGALTISSVLILTGAFVEKRQYMQRAANFNKYRMAFSFILLHGLLCMIFIDGFSQSRFFLSYALLISSVTGGLCLNVLLALNSERGNGNAIHLCFWVLAIIGGIGLFGTLRTSGDVKSVVVFTEPAHFAATIVPFVIYMGITCRLSMSLLYIAICLIFGMLFPSTTFLAVGLLTFLIAFRQYRILLFIVVSMLAVVWLTADNFLGEYHQERLDFGGENLSSLVYRSGWERAVDNMLDTGGLGLGFQQLGITGSIGHSLNEIAYITQGTDLNALDGGSVGAKMISEFGIVGILVLAYWVIYSIKSIKALSRLVESREGEGRVLQIFCHAVFLSIGISLFVRGSGYFSSPALFFFMAVWNLRFTSLNFRSALVK